MRGLPGSGKSWQARALCDQHLAALPGQKRYFGICSTDHYFMQGGEYRFNLERLSEYHQRNLSRFKWLLRKRWPLVICDNTNLQRWEFRTYLSAALRQGYQVEIHQIGLPAKPQLLGELAARNSHGVPLEAIEQMAQRFEPYQTTAIEVHKKPLYFDCDTPVNMA